MRGTFVPRNIYKLLIVIPLGITICGTPQNDKPKKIEPEFATPQKTIEYYWENLANNDYQKALTCFTDYSPENYNKKDILPLPDIDSLKVDSIIKIKKEGKKQVVLYYRVSFYSKRQKLTKTIITGDRLILTDSGWKIKDVLIP